MKKKTDEQIGIPRVGEMSAEEQPFNRPDSSFPIVGIGASAGGLEALELFLSNVPENLIDGVAIPFSDIPSYKKLEAELRTRTAGE